MTRAAATPRRWIAAATTLWFLLVYAHVGLEWLFHATKVSFLSFLDPAERIWVLWLTPLPLALVGWMAVLVLGCPALWAAAWRGERLRRALRLPARLGLAFLPSLLLATLTFVLIDNFTATVLDFHSLTFRGSDRLAYGGFFCLLWVAAYLWCLERLEIRRRSLRLRLRWTAALVGVSLVAWLLLPLRDGYAVPADDDTQDGSQQVGELPDVLLISSESTTASQLAIYDESTSASELSVLEQLSDVGVVFRNHFTNANRTSGSVPSVITGRLPTSTHKLNGRHRMHGANSYLHLPAVLRVHGYRSFLQGLEVHVDPRGWNLRRGFDLYNGKPVDLDYGAQLQAAAGGRLEWPSYFVGVMRQRIRDRFMHSFGFDLAELPAAPDLDRPSPQAREPLKKFLRETEGPVFVATHRIGEPIYHDDFLRFFLDEQSSRPRDLMVVFWSDHAVGHRVDARMPLLIRFPRSVDRSSVDAVSNSQNLDIAPTILDALGLAVPDWMDGASLLGPRSELRPIFLVSSDDMGTGLPVRGVAQGGALELGVVVCQRLWALDLIDGRLRSRDFPDHTSPCAEAELPQDDEVRDFLVDHLRQRDFPVGQIPDSG